MRKESRKSKGFTLAELLVVVAIIAVLVAIAIPVFSAQVESSRESVDMANIRTAVAKVTSSYLTGEEEGCEAVTSGGKIVSYTTTVAITQEQAKWQSKADSTTIDIAGVSVDASTLTKGGVYTISIDSAGVITVTVGSGD